MEGKHFTADRRDHFLRLLEAGESVRAAAHEVGVSRVTVWKWDVHGQAGASPEAVEFSRRYTAAREALVQRAAEDSGPRFTTEKRDQFLDLVAGGATITAACGAVDISPT